MTHDILQRLWIHSGFRHIRTESVSTYMRSYFGHLNAVNLVIFLNNMFQVLLPMKSDHWLIVLVEKQKSSISVYHRFYFRCYPIGKNTTETRHNFLAHRHIADTAFCFGRIDHILHLGSSLKLMVYLDTLLVELKIGDRQPAELRDSQPRVKENIDRIVVSAEMLIFLDEFQKITLLLTGNCFSGDGIVYDHRCQFKSKRIFYGSDHHLPPTEKPVSEHL